VKRTASEYRLLRRRRAVMLRLFAVIAVVASVAGVLRYFQHDLRQAAADEILAAVCLGAFFILKRFPFRYYAVVRVTFAVVLIATFHTLMHQDSPIRFIWLTTVLYFLFFLFNQKEAFRWFFAVGAFFVYIAVWHPEVLRISRFDFVLWMIDIFFVMLISKWYLDLEKESMQRLESAESELRREVALKTAELKRKTEELTRLNATLEKEIARKIEENREQEQMLARQARHAQMGEMLNMIAHQWRQPLHAISITVYAAERALKNGKPTEEVEVFLQRIKEFTRHLSRTIEDFRKFFKIDHEKQKAALCDIVDEAYRIVQPMLEMRGIAFRVTCDKNIVLYTYKNELTHVLLNLFRNAQEAIEGHRPVSPYIDVRIYAEDGWAWITVEDNGGGIPRTIREKIFDPYFTTKAHEGSGLGLYMTKILIERHCKGRIEVDSQKGKTRFTIRLPYVPLEHTT